MQQYSVTPADIVGWLSQQLPALSDWEYQEVQSAMARGIQARRTAKESWVNQYARLYHENGKLEAQDLRNLKANLEFLQEGPVFCTGKAVVDDIVAKENKHDAERQGAFAIALQKLQEFRTLWNKSTAAQNEGYLTVLEQNHHDIALLLIGILQESGITYKEYGQQAVPFTNIERQIVQSILTKYLDDSYGFGAPRTYAVIEAHYLGCLSNGYPWSVVRAKQVFDRTDAQYAESIKQDRENAARWQRELREKQAKQVAQKLGL